jgi:hypothetical protein
MIEIQNKTPGPIQLVVRSFSDRREHAKAMTVLNIPGRKSVPLAEERIVKDDLDRKVKWGLLAYKTITNQEEEI